MHRSHGSAIGLALLVLTIGAACPPEVAPQPTLDYAGLVFDAEEFWPLAVGNYWLWMDPESPTEWVSKKVIKDLEVAGCPTYLMESTNTVGGGSSIRAQDYYVVHPKGIFRAFDDDQLFEWAANSDDMSLLAPVLESAFVRGTLPYPAAYDAERHYTVDSLAALAPFDQCPEDDPAVVNGGPEDFLVHPDHTMLLTHTAGVCGGDTRARIVYGCYARGLGPIIWPGWRRGMLVRAIVDGHEFGF